MHEHLSVKFGKPGFTALIDGKIRKKWHDAARVVLILDLLSISNSFKNYVCIRN